MERGREREGGEMQSEEGREKKRVGERQKEKGREREREKERLEIGS